MLNKILRPTRTFRFYKEDSGCWFIDLKWWPADKLHLEMVMGADDLLDKLARGSKSIHIQLCTRRPKNYDDVIKREHKVPGRFVGAVYKPVVHRLQDNGVGKNKLWLCGVTLFVYLRYPKRIYFNVIKRENHTL